MKSYHATGADQVLHSCSLIMVIHICMLVDSGDSVKQKVRIPQNSRYEEYLVIIRDNFCQF